MNFIAHHICIPLYFPLFFHNQAPQAFGLDKARQSSMLHISLSLSPQLSMQWDLSYIRHPSPVLRKVPYILQTSKFPHNYTSQRLVFLAHKSGVPSLISVDRQ